MCFHSHLVLCPVTQEFQKEFLPGVQLGFGLFPGAHDDGSARFALRGVNTWVAAAEELRLFHQRRSGADLLGQVPCSVY